MYFIGKGDIYIASRDSNGNPGAMALVGECPEFELAPAVEYRDNFSTSRGAPNEQDMHLEYQRALGGHITLKEPTIANLVHILHGDSGSENAGSYTAAESLTSGLAVGDHALLPGNHVNLSSIVLKDSTGTPVTLTLGTHYSIISALAGIIKILSLTGVTQPIKHFSSSYGASSDVKILTKQVGNKVLLFDGLNLADLDSSGNPKPLIIQLHNVSIQPAGSVPFKSDDFSTFQLPFQALRDPLKAVDTALGRFGWIRYPTVT